MPILLAFLAYLVAQAALAVELGEPPRRFEYPNPSARSHDLSPKAAKSRADVVALYRSVFLPGNSVPLNWSGSLSTCDGGVTNLDHQQAVISRVNYYRALVDLPA